MTTIATDGRTIAADGLVVNGSRVERRDMRKIIVLDRHVFALSGASMMLEPLAKWYLAGADPDTVPKSTELDYCFWVIDDARRLRIFTKHAGLPDETQMPWASGSGGDFAMAAMRLGKSPAEAVALAAELDVWTGGEIQVIDIEAALAGERGKFDEIPRAHFGEVSTVLLSATSTGL